MSKFEIICHGRTYQVKRFSVTPFLKDVLTEEYTILEKDICPDCCAVVVERFRTFKDKHGDIKSKKDRLPGKHALFYLCGLQAKRIYNTEVETGSGSDINWQYGVNNSIKNFNDKTVGSRVTNPINNTIQGEFIKPPEQVLIRA